MSFQEKSIKSEKVAKLSYERELYDSSINRYYYSFFQFLKHILKVNEIHIDQNEINKAGSHDKAVSEYIGYLRAKGIKQFPKITKINKCYSEMKQFRKKADYWEEESSKEDVDRFERSYNELKKILSQK